MIDSDYIRGALSHLEAHQRPFAGASPIRLAPGLSDAEISLIEQRYQFAFPPDLRLFLQTAMPVTDDYRDFPDWRSDPPAIVNQRLEGPFLDLWASIRDIPDYWSNQWGERPHSNDMALAIARQYLTDIPKMIPVYRHRYIPASPALPGNPVFSIVAYDIIHYGHDLPSYLHNEFAVPNPYSVPTQPREVPTWSALVR